MATAIDYDLMKREMPKLKSALSRAKNSGDPLKVLAAVKKALDVFDQVGCWPDAWATWKVALEDAWRDFLRSEAADDDDGTIADRFTRQFDRIR